MLQISVNASYDLALSRLETVDYCCSEPWVLQPS
jgi:hypothetical protein